MDFKKALVLLVSVHCILGETIPSNLGTVYEERPLFLEANYQTELQPMDNVNAEKQYTNVDQEYTDMNLMDTYSLNIENHNINSDGSVNLLKEQLDRNIFDDQHNSFNNDDSILGQGFGLAFANAALATAKTKAAILGSVAKAQALTLKAKMDLANQLAAAKVNQALNTARMVHFGNAPLLGAIHESDLQDDNALKIPDIDQYLSQDDNHSILKRKADENRKIIPGQGMRNTGRRGRNKHDENLYLWSLNYPQPYKRTIMEDNNDDVINLKAGPDFWKNNDVSEGFVDAHLDMPQNWKPKITENALISQFQQKLNYAPTNQFGLIKENIPVAAVLRYNNLHQKLGVNDQNIQDQTRAAHLHGSHSFSHSHTFGGKHFNKQSHFSKGSSFGHQSSVAPSNHWETPQTNHWGTPQTNHWGTPQTNHWESPQEHQWGGSQGNWDSPVDSITKNIPKLNPSHVTINNQQNTFTNAVPNASGGSQSIQISQTNGNAAASQAQSTSKARNNFLRESPQENPFNSPIVSSLFQFPNRRRISERSIENNLTTNKEEQQKLEDLIVDEIKYFKLLQNKKLRSAYLELQNDYLNEIRKERETDPRSKRSLPLMKLIMDPNAKLDMPKTLENVGTIARNSFEDKRAPMYHIRNMIGSTKNAVLSALRVAPQDIIIPSQYRIIDKTNENAIPEIRKSTEILPEPDQIVGAAAATGLKKAETFMDRLTRYKMEKEARFNNPFINEDRLRFAPKLTNRSPILGQMAPPPLDDPFNFGQTFQKMGTVLRESIKSGQETIEHINEVAHSARKAWNTAKLAAPRVLMPYSRAAAFQKKDNPFENLLQSRSAFESDADANAKPDISKLMLITPKLFNVKDDDNGPFVGNKKLDYVKMGDIMNAFGLSNPNENKVGLQRIIIQKNEPNVPLIQGRFADVETVGSSNEKGINHKKFYVISEDIEEGDLGQGNFDDTWDALKGIKDVVGSGSLKEFLVEMKNDFSKLRQNKRDEQNYFNAQTPNKEVTMQSRIGEADEELDSFLHELFRKNEKEAINLQNAKLNDTPSEMVGGILPENLLKPFMNRPSRHELNDYFRDNGDTDYIEDDHKKTPLEIQEENIRDFFRSNNLLESINPKLYEERFNETLVVKNDTIIEKPTSIYSLIDTKTNVDGSNSTSVGMANPDINDEDKRFSMKFHEKLLEPYMGKVDTGYEDDYGEPYGKYHNIPYDNGYGGGEY